MRRGVLVDRLPARVAVPLRARFGSRDTEVSELARWVAPGATVWDVGAHKGAYTWHLSRLVGPAGQVHAFEPQPDLAARLRRGVARNVTVHDTALSDEAGTASLSIPVWGTTMMQGHASLEAPPTDTDEFTTVRTVQGDSLALSPTFAKIDVEGHEASVLRGAAATLSRSGTTLLLEIDFRHQHEDDTRAALLQWLSEHGYRAYYVPGHGALLPAPDLRGTRDPNEALAADRYVFNWVFMAGGQPG